MEEQGVSWLATGYEPLEALHHVLAGGPLVEVGVVVQQHAHALLAEAKLGGQQEGHAVGIIDAAVQCTVGAPAMGHASLSASKT